MKPRVLYITGWTRSGSTLVGNVLGELPGVLHVGELHYLWQNGLLGAGTNSHCGCGAQVTECGLWSQVLQDGIVAADPHAVIDLQQRLARTRHTARRVLDHRTKTPSPAAEELADRMAAAYQRLARLGGERLIVDGSKYPAEAALLLGRDDLDVRVLHMVRDPRATAHSYQSAKAYIDPMSPAASSGYWTAFNLASELVGRQAGERYLRVRHEDFCADPRQEITRIIRFAQLDDPSPISADKRVTLGINHTVTGNPDRLTHGEVTIRMDQRWLTALPARARRIATLPAAPLMPRYGYTAA